MAARSATGWLEAFGDCVRAIACGTLPAAGRSVRAMGLGMGEGTVCGSAFGLAAGSPIASIHRGRRMIGRGGSDRADSSPRTSAEKATAAATERRARETERGRHRSMATKEPSLVANNRRPKAAGG
jgi:hypothetical protein